MARISNRIRLLLALVTTLHVVHTTPPTSAQSLLSPEQEATAVEFLSNGVPELAQHLSQLKQERPEEYRHELEQGLRELAEVERTRVAEPEHYRQFMAERELDKRCFELARQLREASEGDIRQSLVTELEQTVGELFDVRESWRSQEIDMLERELERLREEGSLRLRHRAQIVDRRIEELTGLAELYAW